MGILSGFESLVGFADDALECRSRRGSLVTTVAPVPVSPAGAGGPPFDRTPIRTRSGRPVG
jgi:hypothetical protein